MYRKGNLKKPRRSRPPKPKYDHRPKAGQSRAERIEAIKAYLDDCDDAPWLFQTRGEKEKDSMPYDEYLAWRYDDELMRAIKHYKKTGKVIDTGE